MSLTIEKGQSINISKAATDAGAPLTKLIAGAGWDTGSAASIDLDLLTVFLAADGQAIPDENANGTNADEAVCAFFNKDPKGAHHHGDNLTGEGDGDDEQITLTLADVPANVTEVAVVIASYSGQTFGEVENAFVRMVNSDGDTELAKFDLSNEYKTTRAIEMGRLVRNGSSWDFKATGVSRDGSFKEVVSGYGVSGVN